jgi:hypothetical protein
MNGARLPVAEELRLDGKPGVSGGGALRGDDFGEVIGERGNNLGLDDVVHPSLVWGDMGRRGKANMIL